MKKLMRLSVVAALAAALCGCDNNKGGNDFDSDKESMLKKAVTAYVDHTVVPTYKGMADNAILMSEACDAIYEAYLDNTLTAAEVEAAGAYWNLCRDYWERSEAFLYGAAADYNIDPHIDSWPLDRNAMERLLEDLRNKREWSTDNLGYGLLGFHAVEYMLFELADNGNKSTSHNLNYTEEELIYLCAVAEDLRDQCVRLEASWAGMDNITAQKRQILEDAELEPTFNYGESMKTAGQGGSRYKTFQEAAEDLVWGCIDIADEVGNTKIGRPVNASTEDDKNYIESPYSLNSIADFAGNIISIRNAYCGSNAGDASVSDYIRSVNADLDARVRAQIETAIEAINKIPEPFAKTAMTNADAAAAVEIVGSDLVRLLEDAVSELSKNF